jgi:16S rRNA U516 pseudouridylate synthase RsuA-like enzyme
VYQVKVKGRLTTEDLERLGKQMGARMRMIRQPDAARGLRSHRSGQAGNFWYEVTLRDSKRDVLRRVLFAEQHPVEKLKRIGLGPLTLEGLPPGRYRLLEEKEVSELRRALKTETKLQLKKSRSEKRIEHNGRRAHREEVERTGA